MFARSAFAKEHVTGDGLGSLQLLVPLHYFFALLLLLPKYILTGDAFLIAQGTEALLGFLVVGRLGVGSAAKAKACLDR